MKKIKTTTKRLALSSLTATLLLSFGGTAFAARGNFGDRDSNFYTNRIPGGQTTVTNEGVTRNDSSDDSRALQRLIDRTSRRGGGTLVFPSGTYRLRSIDLRSNIRLRFQSGARIISRVPSGRNYTFGIGRDGRNALVENVELVGASNRRRFLVDVRGSTAANVQVIDLGNAQNVKIENLNILDERTRINSITTSQETEDLICRNIDVNDAGIGYGLVQTQAGRNMLFVNLDSDGGVCLRLETGAGTDRSRFLGGIYGRRIVAREARAAAFFRSDGQENGLFDIRNVTARGCAFGIQSNGDRTAFENASCLRDLTVVFGSNAQVNRTSRPFIPCARRGLYSEINPQNSNSPLMGPSLGGWFRRDAPYLNDLRGSDIITTGFDSTTLVGRILTTNDRANCN